MNPHPSASPSASRPGLHVGIIGGGIGGLTAAIAIRRAGCKVTVLEAASQLGEIGAGIQMFGNVSRFLVRTGVDRLIGDDLVQHHEVRTWSVIDDSNDKTPDPMGTGKLIGKSYTKDVVHDQGFPWWVVRRDHLHAGLAEGARQHGAEVVINARVVELNATRDRGVKVVTGKGAEYQFDLVVGADGINSAVRKIVFPDLKPRAASRLAAYRAVLPYETVFEKVPEARSIIGNTMDAWSGPGGYVLLYPLSGGRELNVVTAMRQDHVVETLEDVSADEWMRQYEGWPPFIRRIMGLVSSIQRWPLLVVPPTGRWSNEYGNIALMGDAIHGMQNHMAQGAATSMEDGIFLGRILSEVLRTTITLPTAIKLYEQKRRPRAWHKQQSALCQGETWTCTNDDDNDDDNNNDRTTTNSPRRSTKVARDDNEFVQIAAFSRNVVKPNAMQSEGGGGLPTTHRSSMMFSSPLSVPAILYYDAEADADWAVGEYLQGPTPDDADTRSQDTVDYDQERMVSRRLNERWWDVIWDTGVERWKRPQNTAQRTKAKL